MTAVLKNGLIIAIDGPSGAGKSTVTKQLAEKLGYLHIDTGAMFRTVALFAHRTGISLADTAALTSLLAGLKITFRRAGADYRVFANNEDVSDAIRTPEITLLTSKVAAIKEVRSFLLDQQREMGKGGGVVLEGRDIGTVVFPDAQVKFFLSASPEERGKRRFLELQAKGEHVTLEQTISAVMARDQQDSCRELAPLLRAADAIDVDSTALSIDDVIGFMAQKVAEKSR